MSTLPCLPLMLSLKTIILKYFLVCVFLISPCCVHRDRRPDQTVSVVPSPRFVLFVFSSVLFCSRVLSPRQASPLAASPDARRSREFMPPFAALPSRGSREFYAAVRGSPIPRFAGLLAAVRGSAIPPFAGVDAAVRGSAIPPFAGVHRRPFADQPALSSLEMTPPSTANPSPPACL